MKIIPIISHDIIMRYRKIDSKTVVDSFTGSKYMTSSADKLINKLNKIGLVNSNRINKNIHSKLLYVVA